MMDKNLNEKLNFLVNMNMNEVHSKRFAQKPFKRYKSNARIFPAYRLKCGLGWGDKAHNGLIYA